MKLLKTMLASAALLASIGAHATVAGSLGGGFGTFLSLSTDLTAGPVATRTGGTLYTTDQPFADIPAGTVFQNTFLAAGPTAGAPATLTFTTPLDYISFLWGSPDTYNVLTVNSTIGAAQTFTAAGLGFSQTDGNQSFSQYVRFAATAGQITSLSFNNAPAINAFETANYTITPIPEPETYAMLLLGLGAIGMFARRRRAQ